MFFKITPSAQEYDCPKASEAMLMNMDKLL